MLRPLPARTLLVRVGACAAALALMVELIRRHVLAPGRIHGNETTVPVPGQEQDGYRPAVDLPARRPAVRLTA
jgi:hypothetical protein